MKAPLRSWSESVYCLMRLVLGFTYSCHGAQKLFGVLGGPCESQSAAKSDRRHHRVRWWGADRRPSGGYRLLPPPSASTGLSSAMGWRMPTSTIFTRLRLDDDMTRKVIAHARKEGRLPDLRGVTVYLAGASAASPQKAFEVQKFWLAYFKAANAQLSPEHYGPALINFNE